MGVAESVDSTRVGAVLRPPIVDRDPLKVREHPGVIYALSATTIVQRIESQRLGAGAVKPASPPARTNARLVEMHDRRAGDLLAHPVEERVQVIGAILDERHKRPGRKWCAEPVREQPSGPLIRQMLNGDQIDRQRPHPRPVLGRSADPSWKRCTRHVPAHASPPLRAMLTDRQTHRR